MHPGRPKNHLVRYKHIVWINEDGTAGCFSISKKRTLKKEDEIIITKDQKNIKEKSKSFDLNQTENIKPSSNVEDFSQISDLHNIDCINPKPNQESTTGFISGSCMDINTDPFSSIIMDSINDININPLPNFVTINDIPENPLEESVSQITPLQNETHFNDFSYFDNDINLYPKINASILKANLISDCDIDINNDNNLVLKDIL